MKKRICYICKEKKEGSIRNKQTTRGYPPKKGSIMGTIIQYNKEVWLCWDCQNIVDKKAVSGKDKETK